MVTIPKSSWWCAVVQTKSSDQLRPRLNIYQNTSLAAQGALAHRLQRRTACKIQNGRQGAPKWPTGSGHKLNLFLFSHFPNII